MSDTTLPDHMLITGAVLGHMQALINPVIYGIVWRGMFIADTVPGPTELDADGSCGGLKSIKVVSQEEKQASAGSPMLVTHSEKDLVKDLDKQ